MNREDLLTLSRGDLTDDADPFAIADRLALLKEAEAELALRRVAVEERLIAAVGFQKTEGAQTFTVRDEMDPDPDAAYKVELKANVYRKVDEAEWDSVRHFIPEELHPVRSRLEVDTKAFRALRNNHPEHFRTAVAAIRTNPGKVSVSFR